MSQEPFCGCGFNPKVAGSEALCDGRCNGPKTPEPAAVQAEELFNAYEAAYPHADWRRTWDQVIESERRQWVSLAIYVAAQRDATVKEAVFQEQERMVRWHEKVTADLRAQLAAALADCEHWASDYRVMIPTRRPAWRLRQRNPGNGMLVKGGLVPWAS
jgi:hypothetical protein